MQAGGCGALAVRCQWTFFSAPIPRCTEMSVQSINVNFATESKSVMYIVFSSGPKQQLVAGAGSGIVATFFPSGEITKMPPGPAV